MYTALEVIGCKKKKKSTWTLDRRPNTYHYINALQQQGTERLVGFFRENVVSRVLYF